MIKLAQLANKLDSQGFYKEADELDKIMADIVVLRKKIAKLSPENIKTYQIYSPAINRISNELKRNLVALDYNESNEIINEIKIAGIGDWLSGIGEIIKSPFNSVGNYFKDLAQGGKFKRSIDNSLKNLASIRSLIESGDENSLQQAQQAMLSDVRSLSYILKEAYGDRTFFDDQINTPSEENPSEEVGATSEPISEEGVDVDFYDDNALKERRRKELENITHAKSELMKRYSQNKGSLALINDLAQIEFAIANTKNIKTAFNAWVKVLSVLNGIQFDRRPEPSYQSRNPDINDSSRGGGFNPSGSNRPKGKDLISFFLDKTKGVNTMAMLEDISNKTSLKIAVKYLLKKFPDIYRGDQNAAIEDAIELRKTLKPDKPNYDPPGTKHRFTTK